MKTALLYFLFLNAIFNISSLSQKRIDGCELFPKKGKAVEKVVINAFLTTAEMLPHQGAPAIMYLEKRRKLPMRHHYYAIEIHTDRCSETQWLTCGDRSEEATQANGDETPIKVTLTCLVFRDGKIPYSHNEPVVIVTKMRRR